MALASPWLLPLRYRICAEYVTNAVISNIYILFKAIKTRRKVTKAKIKSKSLKKDLERFRKNLKRSRRL